MAFAKGFSRLGKNGNRLRKIRSSAYQGILMSGRAGIEGPESKKRKTQLRTVTGPVELPTSAAWFLGVSWLELGRRGTQSECRKVQSPRIETKTAPHTYCVRLITIRRGVVGEAVSTFRDRRRPAWQPLGRGREAGQPSPFFVEPDCVLKAAVAAGIQQPVEPVEPVGPRDSASRCLMRLFKIPN